MSEISERLTEALKASKVRSMRALWSALDESGTYNTTYSTVHRYFAGEVEPPLDFLTAAADILGVRAAWLAFGDGPARPREVDIRVAEQQARLDPILRDALGSSAVPRETLKHIWGTVLVSHWHGHDPNERDEEHARAFAGSLVAPLRALGIDPSQVAGPSLENYLNRQIAAITVVMVDLARGDDRSGPPRGTTTEHEGGVMS